MGGFVQTMRYLSAKITNKSSFFIVSAVTALSCSFAVSAIFARENYGSWPDSVKIFINTSNTGATISGNVFNFPVPVRLNPSVFTGFAKTMAGGHDIRFAKPDGTPLPYEIERWKDGANNADTAEIWVLVDTIRGNDPAQFIRMYWGKGDVANLSNPSAVFDTAKGFRGVWHLGESGNNFSGNYKDATGRFPGTGINMNAASVVPGVVGSCQQFDGSANYIKFGKVAIHNFPAYTVAMWVKGGIQRDKRIFCEADTANNNPMFSFGTNRDDAYPEMETFIRDNDGVTQMDHEYAENAVFDGSWHYVAWVDNGGAYSVYIDGEPDWTGDYIKNAKSLTMTSIGAVVRGIPTFFFAGSIDELNCFRTNRSAAWIKLSYATQRKTSSCVSVQPQIPPSITTHPSDVSVAAGSKATMTVVASGTSPLSYTWYKNAVSTAAIVAGQTTSTLTLTNVQTTDAGIYLCVVHNEYGAAESKTAKLTIAGARPCITAQPGDTTVFENKAWSLSVAAAGDPPLSYSWYKSGIAAKVGSDAILSVASAQINDSGTYFCVVSNNFGACSSKTVAVTVKPAPLPAIANPISLQGRAKDSAHVQLTVTGHKGLPASGQSWYADTVLIWYRTGSFPQTPSLSAIPAPVKLPLAAMATDTVTTLLDVSPIGSGSYYFKASVHWSNPAGTPRDSIPPFGGDASGTIVSMGDTSRLPNPLALRFGYTPHDTVCVTVDSLNNAALRWDLIAGATLAYSVTGSSWTHIGLTLPKCGKSFTTTVIDANFKGPEKTVTWRLWLKGVYNNASDTVVGLCKVGAATPENTVTVACFKDGDTMVSVFGGKVVLKKVDNIAIEAKIIHVSDSPTFPGCIPVSGIFRFEPAPLQPAALRLGLRYDSIPPGYSVNDIRMYHYDALPSKWHVRPMSERDSAASMISMRIQASKDTFPVILAIDTAAPAITIKLDDTSAVPSGTEISVQAYVTDNIANPGITLLAGRGDDTLHAVPASTTQQTAWTVPSNVAEGSCGIRILLVANDGRNADTVNLSRDIRVSDADVVSPLYEQWMPLGSSVKLDGEDAAKVLDEYAPAGAPWEYDGRVLRLFRWFDGSWLEYSSQDQDRFSFIPGRLVWLKTRKIGPISLGNGRTVSLRRPCTILLKAKNWTDFTLPYRFPIYMGDISAANGSDASNSLQFYFWNRNQAGRYFLKELYLPSNSLYNDKKRKLEYINGGERMAYSVYNPLDRDVELRIPGTPVALSNVHAQRERQPAAVWSVAVRARSREHGELSPVFCAYRSDFAASAAYPLPPSWSKVSVGISAMDGKRVYGNMLTNECTDGGHVYRLVFDNKTATATAITYSIERFSENDMVAGIFDPRNGTAYGTDSLLSIEVGAGSQECRWLAVGSPRYIEDLGRELTKTELALVHPSPNPFRGVLRISYRVPFAGIASVRCELIDQLGRVVWSTAASQNVRPGGNVFVWDPRKKVLAAGSYIVRLTGFDGDGRKKGEKLARVMYMP